MDAHAHALGNAGASQLLEQLDQIDLALRPFGQTSELGKFFRETLEPIGLSLEHLNRRYGTCAHRSFSPLQLIDSDAHRREWILDLVRHPAGDFAERAQAFGFEL